MTTEYRDPFYGLTPTAFCKRLIGQNAEVTNERGGTVYGQTEALFESVRVGP